jgi:hypothetical protein
MWQSQRMSSFVCRVAAPGAVTVTTVRFQSTESQSQKKRQNKKARFKSIVTKTQFPKMHKPLPITPFYDVALMMM